MVVNQPKQKVFGTELYPSIHEKAGILLINVAKKHAFHNANKRTAWVSMVVFFDINGYDVIFPKQIGIDFVMDTAANDGDFDELKEKVFHFLKESEYIIKR